MIATDRIKEAFAGKLRVLLKERGMRQTALARALNVSSVCVNNYTKGKKLPSLVRLIQIADVLSVSMDELLCTAELRGAER